MEDLVFIRAVEWLVRAGAEAGISVKDMLRLLNAGVSVDTRARPHRAESSGFQRGKCPLFSLGHVAVSASGVRVLTLRVEGAVGKRSTTEVLSPMQEVPVMR